MSPHFHFHNDRNLSSNSTTICFLLDGSCLSLVSQSLSLKPWLVKGVWPEVEKTRQFLHPHTFTFTMTGDCLTIHKKDSEWLATFVWPGQQTNQSNGINLVLALIFILVQKSSFKATILQNNFSLCLPSEAGKHIPNMSHSVTMMESCLLLVMINKTFGNSCLLCLIQISGLQMKADFQKFSKWEMD